MLNSLFNWFGRKLIHIQVRPVRRRGRNGSGHPRWNLVAYSRGACLCMMTLAAHYTPAQYEAQLSKLLGKIYRRYRWLVGSITYLSPVDN